MKKIFSFFCAAILAISALIHPAGAEAVKAYHWYTTRNKTHKQALVPELAFVEEHGGVYIDRAHGDATSEKVVYLTFDVGYENGNVEKTLNALKETQTPAAFFVLKHFVTDQQGLVTRMAAEGHLICNHTAHHPDLSFASKEKIAQEIKELEEAVVAVTGSGVRPYFRPPEGSFSIPMLETVSSLGYKTVFWSFAYADWDNDRQPEPQAALARILAHMHNGAVILLHPTSATNAKILPELIGTLKAQGYRFGTLDELCCAR